MMDPKLPKLDKKREPRRRILEGGNGLNPFEGLDPWGAETDVERRDAEGRTVEADDDGEGEAGDEGATGARPPAVTSTRARNRVMRRVMGERTLEDAFPGDAPAEGESWHVLTYGGLASSSFLLWLAHRQRLRRLMLSTWSLNETDVDELRRLVRLGMVGRLDVYCGALAERRTPKAWLALREVCAGTGGRCVTFRNHSKVVAWQGEAWDGVLEGSANLANNGSMEQVVLTRDAGLAAWYFGAFDEIRGIAEGESDGQGR